MMVEEKINPKSEKTVLKKALGGGPHGLGDPNDLSLRKVEEEVLIPKKVREKAKKEKCADEVEAFGMCAKENGFLVVTRCREENDGLINCVKKWFYDKDFVEMCRNEYLQERSEYRRTGIPLKQRLAEAQKT